MRELEQKLHYQFKDSSRLLTALTHPSYGADHHQPHYQRLEFLGDAVLQLAISQHLCGRYPDVAEGVLTRARASIVCEGSLFEAADELGLGRYIRLSPGEERSGGRNKPSILSDVLEAIFAAVYMDGGLDAAFLVIDSVLKNQLEGDLLEEKMDHKSLLQMRVQRNGLGAPTYELTSMSGEPHKPLFTMRVSAGGQVLGEGSGPSKQAAQQQAAKEALDSGNIM